MVADLFAAVIGEDRWPLVKHARYFWLPRAESHLTQRLFGGMVQRIAALPLPVGQGWRRNRRQLEGREEMDTGMKSLLKSSDPGPLVAGGGKAEDLLGRVRVPQDDNHEEHGSHWGRPVYNQWCPGDHSGNSGIVGLPMILWISLALAVVAGLIQPFSKRLQATGLWAGKALVPEEAAHAYPRGLQDALTDGWPSSLGWTGGMLPFVAAVVGFFYTWWAGIAAFVASVVVAVIAERTPIASPYVERYLTLLVDHLNNRRANYKKAGDSEREQAAAELLARLTDLQILYVGSQSPAPDIKTAKAAPFGDYTFLLNE